MIGFIKDLFRIEKDPHRGLMAYEKVSMGYLFFTLVLILFMFTRLPHAEAMLWGRLRIAVITLALWGVYRLVPCRITRFVRALVQLLLLAWWYPDTYEINRVLPNLDHVFASWEQQIFGCQPALEFSAALPSHIISELFDMGYSFYYPMIGLVIIYYFGWRYKEFERATFIVLGAFFVYYLLFIFIPVTGPTYYYNAVGLKTIMAGVFPNVHNYFNFHQDCLTAPGWQDGVFYNFVEGAKAAGERPTAAFPSSHVGISTVVMLLVAHARNKRLLLVLLPFYIFLCCATVYIQAHYLIDALAGFATGVLFFAFFLFISKPAAGKGKKSRR